jgi:hypothetical protein
MTDGMNATTEGRTAAKDSDRATFGTPFTFLAKDTLSHRTVAGGPPHPSRFSKGGNRCCRPRGAGNNHGAEASEFVVTVYAALKRRSSTWIAGNTNNSRSLHCAVADAPAPVGMTGVFALQQIDVLTRSPAAACLPAAALARTAESRRWRSTALPAGCRCGRGRRTQKYGAPHSLE